MAFLKMQSSIVTLISCIKLIRLRSKCGSKLCVTVFDRNGQDLFSDSGETISPFSRLPVLRQREKVSIVHAENSESDKGSFIALHYTAYADAVAEFLDELHEYAESAEALVESIAETVCVAKSPADEQWYRAKILNTEPELTVEYLDYGNTEVVPLENLRKIDSTLAYPPLFAVSPIFLPVSSFTASELLETYADADFVANFKLHDGKWFADLETTDGISVRSTLVDSGKAEELSPPPFTKPESALLRWQAEGTSPQQQVVCTYVDNVNLFYLQLAGDTEMLDKLQSGLQSDLFKMMPLVGRSDNIFAAKYVVDDTWYRAEFSSDEMVRFIDYGNEDALNEIRKLPVKYLEEGCFSVACSLPVIPAEGNEWSDEIVEKFRSLIVEAEEVVGEILSVEENVASVKLTINNKDVSDILIEEGLAAAKPVVLPISHINSLTDFYIQKDLPACDKMAGSLVDAESWDTIDVLTEGLLVAAKFDEDELFYRATITEVTENSSKVLFIDYGNSAIVSDIRELPDILKCIKPLATKCSLDVSLNLVAPETVDKFSELSNFGETYFTLKIIEETDVMTKVDLLLEGESVTKQLVEFNDQNIEVVAKISHINSPTSFYIQYIRDEAILNMVTDVLFTASTFENVSEATEGLMVAAKFEDNAYYRAKVLSDMKIFFVDFGNIAPSDILKTLPESIIDIPPLAKHCALKLPENMEAFSTSSQEIFDSVTGGLELKIKYLNFDDPRLVVAELDGQNVVNLLLQAYEETVEVNVYDDSFCTISHVNSPSDFYIQKDGENLDTVTSVLADECVKPVQIEEITVGSNVAAKFVDDDMWYRAEVLSKDEATDGFCVLFIDFGNTSVAHEFAEIPETISEIPPLALKFSLKLPQSYSEWPEQVNEPFSELLATNEFKCEIVGDEESAVIDLKCGTILMSEELAKYLSPEVKDIPDIKVKTENEDDMATEEFKKEDDEVETEELKIQNDDEMVTEELKTENDDDMVTEELKTENDDDMVLEKSSFESKIESRDEEPETDDDGADKIDSTLEDTETSQETEKIATPVKDTSMSDESSGIEYSPADYSEKEDSTVKESEKHVTDIQEKIDAMNIEADEIGDTTAESIEFVKEHNKSKEIIDLSMIPSEISVTENSVNDTIFSVEDLDDCDQDCILDDVNCSFKSVDAVDELKSVNSLKLESEEEDSKIPSPEKQIEDKADNTSSEIHIGNSVASRVNGSKLSLDVDYKELPGLAIKKELTFDDEAAASDLNNSKTMELDDSAVSFSSSANNTVIEAENLLKHSEGSTSPSKVKSVVEDKIVPGSINRGDLLDPLTLTQKLSHEEKIVPGIVSSVNLSTLSSASETLTDDECSNMETTSKITESNNISPVLLDVIPLDEKLCVQALKEPLQETSEPVPKIPQDEKILPVSVSGADSTSNKEIS